MKFMTDSQWKAHQGLIADLKRQLAERDAEVESLTGQLSAAEKKSDDLNENLILNEWQREAERQSQKVDRKVLVEAIDDRDTEIKRLCDELATHPDDQSMVIHEAMELAGRFNFERRREERANHYEELADQRQVMGIDDASGDGRNYRRLAERYFDMDLQHQKQAIHPDMQRTL
jgi:chromosome segregation ATPase